MNSPTFSRSQRAIPTLRGRLLADQSLAELTWFRVGGPAQVLFMPEDEADLCLFPRQSPGRNPGHRHGLGSNLIVRDGGVPGVVVRLGRGFGEIAIDGLEVRAGAAVPDVRVARAAQEAGIAGLSFLRGIPGGIGGALRMNGGAYGRETKDALVSGPRRRPRRPRPCARQCRLALQLPAFRRARRLHFHRKRPFAGVRGDPAAIAAEMDKITESREATQPIKSRTGGSTFKNPPGQKAWQLIDAAGCRGLRLGDAQVSEMHCNFLINLGNATATDIEALGETVRRRVRRTFRRGAGMGDQADRGADIARPGCGASRPFLALSILLGPKANQRSRPMRRLRHLANDDQARRRSDGGLVGRA